MPTPKQEKLINLIVGNLGEKGFTKSMNEMMLEAGYSKAQAKNPYQIVNSETIKEATKPFVNRLNKERERILAELEAKDLSDERYKDLVDGMDKITKNVQLLSGGATENKAVIIEGFNFIKPE